MQSQLIAVDHDFLYGVVEFDVVVGLQRLGQPVHDLIEVAAVGPGAAVIERDLAHQPPVPRCVAATVDAEHPPANVDHLRVGLFGADRSPAHLTGCSFRVVLR